LFRIGHRGTKVKNHKNTKLILLLVIICTAAAACLFSGSGSVESTKEDLFNGVTYIRQVRTEPRDMVVHIVKIHVALGGIRPIVTEPDRPNADKPYNARTTSEFLSSTGVQLAVNGGGFEPWYDLGLIYTPHTGDPVAPLGTTVVKDFSYTFEESQKRPMLGFNGGRPAEINWVTGTADYVVSGIRILVDNGAVVEDLDGSKTNPRTAVGVSEDGHHLVFVIVDGRQAGYSQGATLQELAQILLENGAYRGMELDGGGSSTLVIEGDDGQPLVLNSPVHQGIDGRERPVATHIGFYINN
jgi:hypothetical protein